ncbi:bifunctional hydroxymethylpyrimidine kinase/phosphomethylpyrimidine kinase, partial [Rhodovulum imhoffii]|uniref:bifunctional hydroxymethylpyrimidine kinase/phosphomethylpyrimidine kinase n=1 Tax=Rhodovulum imhoffii TaxID=365340 RepID=UPI001911FEA2
MIPNILSVAGSDPSGGAGIQADIKAISANGGYAMAALTALTAQNTRGVIAVQGVAPGMVTDQIGAIRADIRIDAVKIGMLGDADTIRAVADALRGVDAPVVLDPVMVSKSGDRLLRAEAVDALRDTLLPMAAVITPNIPEAADLLKRAEAGDRAGMVSQAEALKTLGPRAVLLKGGHLAGLESPDLLLMEDGKTWFDGVRQVTRNTHGTGCTLSSALATELGKGLPLKEAVARAKAYVAGAIGGAGPYPVPWPAQ